MKKSFKIVLVLVAIIFITFYVIRIRMSNAMISSVPDYTKNIELKNITGEVTIYRDQYAVPHIYATNEQDLYRATGYVMAQDRLWQMDLIRRVTQGRLSEVLPADIASVDLLFRSLQIDKKSKWMLDSLDKNQRDALIAFSDGVNQFIESNQEKLPVEFKILKYKPENWQPSHSLNLIGYMAWSLKGGWTNLFIESLKDKVDDEKRMELLPNTTLQKNNIFAQNNNSAIKTEFKSLFELFDLVDQYSPQILNASNNWCVSGNKSLSGKPIFANDMHLEYALPGTWFQVHQVIEGQLNVSGVAISGAPIIIAGHNNDIAWGLTNTYSDNVDFYEEKVNPENPGQYELNGEWVDFKIITEEVKRKKGEDLSKKVRYSHRGPVISDLNPELKNTISMKWIGTEYSNEFSSLYKLNRAKNWDEFKSAIKGFKSVSQNINYADTEGNIGLYCAAGIPIRKREIGLGFLPGWTDEYDWKGLLPFEELPFKYNPESNYVVAANNKATDDDYPHHIGTWFALPYRYLKIIELLENKEKFSPGDFMQIQSNNHSILAQEYSKKIIGYINDSKDALNNQQRQCFEAFKLWDYNYDKNSNMALLFEQTYLQIVSNLFKDELGDELFNTFLGKTKLPKYAMENAFNQRVYSWSNDITTTDIEENFKDIVVKSFAEAVNNISKKLGGNMEKWEWGKMHTLTLNHPLGKADILDKFLRLNKGPYQMSGTWHTISQYSYNFADPYKMVLGSSQRHIYDLSNWDNSLTIMPTGNCGIAASEHYVDQTKLYINNMYHEENFSKNKVVTNAKYIMSIKGK